MATDRKCDASLKVADLTTFCTKSIFTSYFK